MRCTHIVSLEYEKEVTANSNHINRFYQCPLRWHAWPSGPLSLTYIKFNPSTDNYTYLMWFEITYPFPNCNGSNFHTAQYKAYDYLFMLGFNLNMIVKGTPNGSANIAMTMMAIHKKLTPLLNYTCVYVPLSFSVYQRHSQCNHGLFLLWYATDFQLDQN